MEFANGQTKEQAREFVISRAKKLTPQRLNQLLDNIQEELIKGNCFMSPEKREEYNWNLFCQGVWSDELNARLDQKAVQL